MQHEVKKALYITLPLIQFRIKLEFFFPHYLQVQAEISLQIIHTHYFTCSKVI